MINVGVLYIYSLIRYISRDKVNMSDCTGCRKT